MGCHRGGPISGGCVQRPWRLVSPAHAARLLGSFLAGVALLNLAKTMGEQPPELTDSKVGWCDLKLGTRVEEENRLYHKGQQSNRRQEAHQLVLKVPAGSALETKIR